ncbi:MAG: hypothetical protein AVDCRST_MAG33-811 [uncultured Thermomicrobiales bacterium]|uniref:Bacterial type II secretion system protein E domain-containing protein n=1 Tax=uncultured Thermomicrobiales bacterium TaxID=1645740 RepID=A0A6J4UK17_9BACT|nr:MAG: hypothetical protein AVDCRST_MAG33-811 [uncultured Thermomicrobiales bacterium]
MRDDDADGMSSSQWFPTSERRVDPLYPEPGGDPRWEAERGLDWRGPGRRRGGWPSLRQLIATGVLSIDAAALLVLLAGHRASVLVIAASARAGKSTLLEALLPWYPDGHRRIRLRGSFETFAWEQDPRFRPDQSVLVAEEISGHLPTYLWGPGVARFLGWRDRGCALAATAHGDSLGDIGQLLAGYPLRLPLASLLAFDAVVRLGPSALDREAGSGYLPVTTVWSATPTDAGGLVPATLLDDAGLHLSAVGDSLARLRVETRDVEDDLSAIRRRIDRGTR